MKTQILKLASKAPIEFPHCERCGAKNSTTHAVREVRLWEYLCDACTQKVAGNGSLPS